MKYHLADCLKDLEASIQGNVLTDEASRLLYATDASVYQQCPKAVVQPRHRQDCVVLIRKAAKHGMSLIPRAAGTSLAGQAIGDGAVVDISRHMKKVLEVATDVSWVRVQPGVILQDLNDQLRPHGVMFAPDPATADRCMIGGMIGNNAAGAHSVLHGTTREHILEVEAVLADGSVARFEWSSEEKLKEKCRQDNLEGQIYKGVTDILTRQADSIAREYPKPEIIRRNMGFALDLLSRDYHAGKGLNLARLLCGSEGTLALITEAKLRLTRVAVGQAMVCAHFHSMEDALASVPAVLTHRPSAVELLDRRIVELALANPAHCGNCEWLHGIPAAVLMIEFHGKGDDQAEDKAARMIHTLRRQQKSYHHALLARDDTPKAWALRKAGLGMLMGVDSRRKPVAVIEDAAVAPSELAAYARDVQAIIRRHEVACVFYGHASVGLLHLRPELDLSNENDRRKFTAIAAEVAALVKHYRGSLSGEHGDGRVRAPYLRQMLGDTVYELNRQVKTLFDPAGILNPGVMFSEQPIDRNLRAVKHMQADFQTGFVWREDSGLAGALERCNGASVCKRSAGRGVMCPSYQATGEEKHSPRGRANLLRQMLATMPLEDALQDTGLWESLETCLGCKACKSECPAGVDVAKVKAEYLYQCRKHGLTSFQDLLRKRYSLYLKYAAKFPRLANRLGVSRTFLELAGIRRRLPAIAGKSFADWWREQPQGQGQHVADNGDIYLLCDISMQYIEPQIGMAAVRVLHAMGYRVRPVLMKTSPVMLVSQGFLDEARTALHDLLDHLVELQADEKSLLVGLEPAELLTMRDEAKDIVAPERRKDLAKIAARSCLFDEFIARCAQESHDFGKLFRCEDREIAIHMHCHQRALGQPRTVEKALALIGGAKARVLNSGCCGMAGMFGYLNPEMSERIAHTSLAAWLEELPEDTVLVASGSSCRQQFHELFHRQAMHPAQLLAGRLAPQEVA